MSHLLFVPPPRRKIKLRNPWGHPLQGYRGHSPQNPRGHNMGSQWWVERGAVLDDLEPYAPTSTFEGNAGDVFTLDFSDFLRWFTHSCSLFLSYLHSLHTTRADFVPFKTSPATVSNLLCIIQVIISTQGVFNPQCL